MSLQDANYANFAAGVERICTFCCNGKQGNMDGGESCRREMCVEVVTPGEWESSKASGCRRIAVIARRMRKSGREGHEGDGVATECTKQRC
ncbi:hypothetical protein ACH5RR_025437 [Cinchona calisaya]|uniref:Uncharacterized protein n=1 Tax=Cinchona calisaya TaxID=153742 RepID=A0ABD2YZM5_9GENT